MNQLVENDKINHKEIENMRGRLFGKDGWVFGVPGGSVGRCEERAAIQNWDAQVNL